MTTAEHTSEKLKDDLKALREDISALAEHATAQLSDAIAAAKEAARDIPEKSREILNHTTDSVDDFVKTKPYQAAGVAALIGAIVGVAIARK